MTREAPWIRSGSGCVTQWPRRRFSHGLARAMGLSIRQPSNLDVDVSTCRLTCLSRSTTTQLHNQTMHNENTPQIPNDDRSTKRQQHQNQKQQNLRTRRQRQRINSHPKAFQPRGSKGRQDTPKFLHTDLQEQTVEFTFHLIDPLLHRLSLATR